MKPSLTESYGAPLTQVASRVLYVLLLAVLATPLFADGPENETEDWLGKAATSLENGDAMALEHAAKALEDEPLGADENRTMALAMFWAGHFEDAARYMRRALAGDPNALIDQPVLAELMPGDDAVARLNELALKTEKDTELCFLTGTLLLINQDRPRALAFLVRAGELAGTDGQAEQLVDDDIDRNEIRGIAAFKQGDYADAVRSFTFAALDSPTVAENYAGLILALACSGDTAVALELIDNVYARYSHKTLFDWLRGLEVRATDLATIAAKLEANDTATLDDYKLAMLLYVTAEYWYSAREAGVQGLLIDKLDDFIHDTQIWLDENNLRKNPSGARLPEDIPPENGDISGDDTPGESPTLEQARKHIRASEFTEALKILDTFVTEDADPQVYFLVFVCAVGRGELSDASAALQLWFKKASDDERMKLNAVRQLFAKDEQFDRWRNQVTVVRDADPNVGLPRLLNSYIEVTRGRYNSARDELIVARIESPGNAMVVKLDELLGKPEYERDTTPEGIPDDPTPKALFGRGERMFREGKYEQAKGAYLQALEQDPELPFLAAGLFRCYFALGDYDNAYNQLLNMLEEQKITERDASIFQLLLEAGYEDTGAMKQHLKVLEDECEARPLSWKPWLVYGMVLLDRKDYASALDAMQTWHDNVPGERDALLLKFYELAKQRAS